MAGVLEVWIAQPDNLGGVDDDRWTLSVHDAMRRPLVWQNKQFVGLQAHHGHWAGTVPPGHYVVTAQRRSDRDKLRTHPALVQVGCEGIACVRLFADPPEEGEEGGGKEQHAEPRRDGSVPRRTVTGDPS